MESFFLIAAVVGSFGLVIFIYCLYRNQNIQKEPIWQEPKFRAAYRCIECKIDINYINSYNGVCPHCGYVSSNCIGQCECEKYAIKVGDINEKDC